MGPTQIAGKRRLGIGTALGLMLAAGAMAAPVAQAAPANILAGDPVLGDVYNPTSYAHEGGTLATMTWNGGTGSHDVESTNPAFPFSSGAPISSGTDTVNGTQFLPRGSYGFICSVHGATMAGTLNVFGEAKPRPIADVEILSKSLDQVVDSGKLRVRVTASAGATGDLIARLGKRRIGKNTNLTGKTIKLSRSGIRRLDDREVAKVKVTARVDFGTPATAREKLK